MSPWENLLNRTTKAYAVRPRTNNRIEDPEMNPHTHGHLIFDKGAKTIQ